jgi:hypothetical protein
MNVQVFQGEDGFWYLSLNGGYVAAAWDLLILIGETTGQNHAR